MRHELVSVIIPTFNSSRTVETCLRSIKAQTYSNIEIVVIDNNSTDGTAEIARTFGGKIIRGKFGMSAARNVGVKSSAGDFIFNIDSDYELDPRMVEDCVDICLKGAEGVCIHELFVADSYWSKCRMIEQTTYWDDEVVEVPRFLRRELFEGIGGYDETLTAGEDYDFGQRLRMHGRKIASSKYVVKHHELGTLKYIVFKKYRYGKSINVYIDKYGASAFTHFSFVRPAWIRNRGILFKQPQYAVGIVFIKYLQYFVSFLGFLQRGTAGQ